MKVKSIHIYPIKGMKGSKLNSVQALVRGLENDRRYILINNKNVFISQRSHPILATIAPCIIGDEMRISYENSIAKLALNERLDEIIEFMLFENTVRGYLVSEKMDEWFSNILGESVRLVKMTKDIIRNKELIKGPKSTEVSYADGYPILVLGTSSMEHLNSKLHAPIEFTRFRPNILIETNKPHSEDELEIVKIGSAQLQIIKPCARCQVITIDQRNGVKGVEPLKTLASYRKVGNKVNFGANAILIKEGAISVGDTVEKCN